MDFIGVIQVIQAACSLVSLVITLSVYFENKGNRPAPPSGYKITHKSRSWLILLSSLLSMCVFYALIYVFDMSDWKLYLSIVMVLVSILSLLLYARMADKSFATQYVYAPKRFWQVFYNKIPSYLEEHNGPYDIRIVTIGISEDGAAVKEIEEIIDSHSKETFISEDRQLFNIRHDEHLFEHITDGDHPHGIIVLIGDGEEYHSVTTKLRYLAKKFPEVPIGFKSLGGYPGSDHIPPYTNFSGKRTQDYVDYLIMRHYTRSGAWKRLCNRYHRYFSTFMIALSLVLIVCPVLSIIGKYRRINSSVSLAYPDGSKKDSITRVIKSMFISPAPEDVKFWEKKDYSKDSIFFHNFYRFAENGRTSSDQSIHSLIGTVIQSQLVVLYDRNLPEHYLVWDYQGKRVYGRFDKQEDIYRVEHNDYIYRFQWHPSPENVETLDDMKIRVMYSYNGRVGVEVLYDKSQRQALKMKIKRPEHFILDLQRSLVMEDIIRSSKMNSNKNTDNKKAAPVDSTYCNWPFPVTGTN